MNALVERPGFGQSLPIRTETITLQKLKIAVRKLKIRKAAVQVPAEFIKALLQADAPNDDSWLLKLMRLC